MADLLLSKGYRVWGLVRHSSVSHNLSRIEHNLKNPNLILIKGDLCDDTSLRRIVGELEACNADRVEVYHLAAQSFVGMSFDTPETTIDSNCRGTLKLLEVLRASSLGSKLRVYQASTSEMFGKVRETPQTEETPFYPRSPYGVSKVFAYWLCKNYRESYGMFISNGILFNHESPRRGQDFVTRKITLGIARILGGDPTPIELGNIDALRDWGHAKDYVLGMWMILQHDTPDDWVLSSQETHSVREFIEKAFGYAGVTIEWTGTGVDEIGKNSQTGDVLVRISPKWFRPAEVDLLLGDSTRARTILGWSPEHTFDDLVRDMIDADVFQRPK